nr:hypothetical protein CFP56_16218 [Quercus suber]
MELLTGRNLFGMGSGRAATETSRVLRKEKGGGIRGAVSKVEMELLTGRNLFGMGSGRAATEVCAWWVCVLDEGNKACIRERGWNASGVRTTGEEWIAGKEGKKRSHHRSTHRKW